MSGKLSASGTAGPESPTQLLSQDRETPILNSAVPDAPQMAAASSSGEHRSASTQRTRPQPLSWSNGHASPDLTPREASVLGDRDPCSSQDQRPSLSQRVRTRLSLSRIRSISLTASACVSSVQETVSSLRDDALANPGPPLNQDQKIVSLRGADPETCPLAETRASSVYSNDEWDLSYYEEPRVEPPTSSESSTTAPPRADVARRAQSTGRQEIAYPPPESSGYCTASWDASGALHSRSLSTGARPYRRPATRLIVMVKRGSGVIPGNPSALENVRKRYKLPPYGESQVERAPTPPVSHVPIVGF
ncbi:hypothetical protein CC86DRAFT_368849 [Ophiobolus disseminans]|uniref:Uncharacterized protein n=1 Tax=Ophiobolus disseminans TaxID=1469910 RepID=A0A6A7A7M1_9PLEO|nr:hypothetical protein CC86DRAFT_368849 [Ophiobolus disseminans]